MTVLTCVYELGQAIPLFCTRNLSYLCSDGSMATSQVPINLRVANGTLAGWDSCGDQAGELERDAPSSCMLHVYCIYAYNCMHAISIFTIYIILYMYM